MKQNVGGIDQKVRIVIGILAILVGIASLAGYLALGTGVGVVLVLIGLILGATGVAQKCPVNQVAGIDTSK